MPYRAYHIALGLLGLLAVLALLLFRADPDRHAQTGPRWKQRLLTAGLVLLAAFGIGPACKSTTSRKPTATTGNSGTGMRATAGGTTTGGMTTGAPAKAQPKYATTAEWKQIQSTLQEAGRIAHGGRGSHPFDKKGKKRILASIDTAGQNADALATRGLLDASEAGLLRMELKLLSSKVRAFRPTEMRMATCYEPMMRILEGEVSLKRLRDRLPLLQRMAAAKRLHPKVVRKVLGRIKADLFVLSTPTRLKELKPARRVEAKNLVRQVEAQLKVIKIKLMPVQPPIPKSSLEKDPRWQSVVAAWKTVQPLATNSSRSTTKQRKLAFQKLTAALAAVTRLAKDGKLTNAEASLLRAEANRLKTGMYSEPPSDAKVSCYNRMMISPAKQSLKRLALRLPLLERMANAGTLRWVVVDKVLPPVRADLKRLSAPSVLKTLQGAVRKKADETVRKIKAVVQKIERRRK